MAAIISMLSIAHTPPNEITRLFITLYSSVLLQTILHRHFTNNYAILGNMHVQICSHFDPSRGYILQ